MASPDAAFSAVRFCSYILRCTQYITIGLFSDSYAGCLHCAWQHVFFIYPSLPQNAIQWLYVCTRHSCVFQTVCRPIATQWAIKFTLKTPLWWSEYFSWRFEVTGAVSICKVQRNITEEEGTLSKTRFSVKIYTDKRLQSVIQIKVNPLERQPQKFIPYRYSSDIKRLTEDVESFYCWI